jgi:hypothetical protein
MPNMIVIKGFEGNVCSSCKQGDMKDKNFEKSKKPKGVKGVKVNFF